MLNTHDVLEKYLTGEFSLDLMDIVLTQRTVEQPLIFRGKGSVRFTQGAEHFSLRVYTDLPPRPEPGMGMGMIQWPGFEETNVGDPLPPHDFFDLEATDLDGLKWHCEDIFIHPILGRGVVLTSQLRTLTCVSPLRMRTEHDHVTSYFFGDLELPFSGSVNRTATKANGEFLSSSSVFDRQEFSGGAFKFVASRIEHHRDICFVQVTAPLGALAASAESRINEAFSYALGRPLHASITQRLQEAEQIVTLNHYKFEHCGMFDPPVRADSMLLAKDFWALFAAYFVHTVADPVANKLHPLSRQLLRVLFGSRSNLDVASLLVCVAVEGVLKFDEFRDVPFPENNQDTTEPPAKSRCGKRKKAEVSPTNKLLTLQQHRFVSSTMVEAWRDLRHSTAHGEMSPETWIEDRFVQRILTVYALLNRLIFLVIGYQGKHTDFSLPGWPDSHFHGNGHFEAIRLQWRDKM